MSGFWFPFPKLGLALKPIVAPKIKLDFDSVSSNGNGT
jgi:hypothetical protein